MAKKQRVVTLPFELDSINTWGQGNAKFNNWPSVYTLNDSKKIYVGESGGLQARFQQHKKHAQKKTLTQANLLIEETFNKSACLDLESHLIRYFAADAQFEVLNLNSGISEADYYNRPEYKIIFDEIFDELHTKGFLKRSVPELINSLLFKYSPFKSLTPDQEIAVSDILETLVSDTGTRRKQRLVVSGDPGTGKTIVAVYLVKLLADIQQMDPREALDDNSRFVEFFLGDNAKSLKKYKEIALLVPQQSLRETLKLVFDSTPGLNKGMVISPFDLGKSEVKYDLVVVDESHRLQVRNNQASGPNNKLFKEINIKLFGRDDPTFNQLDWITKQSRNQILFLDPIQTVFNGDLPLGERVRGEVHLAGGTTAQFTEDLVLADRLHGGCSLSRGACSGG
jgi:predicted GIY-YIG superfamily endonuclease